MKTIDPNKELSAMIDYLRSKGVVSYKGFLKDNSGPFIELVLLPDAPQVPEKESKKSKDEKVEKKKGADGRTAEEQRELYGSVLDAEE